MKKIIFTLILLLLVMSLPVDYGGDYDVHRREGHRRRSWRHGGCSYNPTHFEAGLYAPSQP